MSSAPCTTDTRIAAALIDLDGTLLDSIPDLAHAANAMREELGMPPLSLELLTTFVGKGVGVLVQRTLAGQLDASGVPASQFDLALPVFNRHYHAVNGEKSSIYPGVIDGLNAMRAQGIRLALVTNKPEEFTLPLLERTGLTGFFDEIVSGDTCARKKPDPMPMLHACKLLGVAASQAIAIGDSMNDALAGKAAGMRVLAVPYGYNEGVDVRSLEVDGIVLTLLEASHWIARQQH